MSTSVVKSSEPLAVDVRFDGASMRVRLQDGREVAVPLAWFPKLRDATPAQRKRWRLIGKGVGIHWEALGEDLSVSAFLKG